MVRGRSRASLSKALSEARDLEGPIFFVNRAFYRLTRKKQAFKYLVYQNKTRKELKSQV